MPNAALAYRVLDHIREHPEDWMQDVYLNRDGDHIRGCFAGLTCVLSGDRPRFLYDLSFALRDPESFTSKVVTVDGLMVFVPIRAEELLDASRYPDEQEDLQDLQDLFASNNSLEDLERIVLKIFGLRPDGEDGR